MLLGRELAPAAPTAPTFQTITVCCYPATTLSLLYHPALEPTTTTATTLRVVTVALLRINGTWRPQHDNGHESHGRW